MILHVVYTADLEICDKQGTAIPVLELKDLLDYQTYRYYKSWVKKAAFIPCEALAPKVPSIIKVGAVQAASVHRLEQKSEYCRDILNYSGGDLEETFYRILCRSLGMKVNAIPMEQLAIIAPFSLVRKCAKSSDTMEALFLGQAGMLHSAQLKGNVHLARLKDEYAFLQNKFQLKPMPVTAWKLFRLRPQNFPAVRLAQLAAIYAREGALAQKVIDATDLESLKKLFLAPLTTGFWLNHYTLDKDSEPKTKRLGKSAIELLVINAVVPFMFALASYNRDQTYQEKAIKHLEQLPAEKNTIIGNFNYLGFAAESAFDSQGLLGLYKDYCQALKCLNCKVGINILKEQDYHG